MNNYTDEVAEEMRFKIGAREVEFSPENVIITIFFQLEGERRIFNIALFHWTLLC